MICIQDIPPGRVALDDHEIKDLNRGRAYVNDVAMTHRIICCDNITDATMAAVSKLKPDEQMQRSPSMPVGSGDEAMSPRDKSPHDDLISAPVSRSVHS